MLDYLYVRGKIQLGLSAESPCVLLFLYIVLAQNLTSCKYKVIFLFLFFLKPTLVKQ